MNSLPTPPPPDERLPRYQQIRDDLARRIAASEWLPEQAIPTESELCAAYAVSIGTLRKAIDVLEGQGLLLRSQGRGTFVRRPQFDSSLFRFFRFKGRNGQAVQPAARLVRKEIREPVDSVRQALKLAPDEAALQLQRLRLIEGAAVLCEDIWLPLGRFGALADLALDAFEDLLYPLYEKCCRQVVASATETLRVELATAPHAAALGVALGAPLIHVQRTAFDFAGQPLEWRSTWGAAEGFEYQIEIR